VGPARSICPVSRAQAVPSPLEKSRVHADGRAVIPGGATRGQTGDAAPGDKHPVQTTTNGALTLGLRAASLPHNTDHVGACDLSAPDANANGLTVGVPRLHANRIDARLDCNSIPLDFGVARATIVPFDATTTIVPTSGPRRTGFAVGFLGPPT
jgi:hypothetical protein